MTGINERLHHKKVSNIIKTSTNVVNLQVHAHLSFLRNIQTNDQSFECTLTLTFVWYEHVQPRDVSGWRPEILFTNAINDLKMFFCKTMIEPVDEYVTKCIHMMIFKGEFAEHFELKQFPLDCQRLHIHAILLNCPRYVQPQAQANTGTRSSHLSGHSSANYSGDHASISGSVFGNERKSTCNEFRLVKGNCSFHAQQFIDSDSWKVIEPFNYWKVHVDNFLECAYTQDLQSSTRDQSSLDSDGPHLSFRSDSLHKLLLYVTVQRKPIYYLWNIVFPISLEVTLSLVTTLVDASDIGTKTAITLTIILTLFAVKFSCLQYIPVINCVTYLDMYLITSTIFVCMVMSQNIVVFLLNDGADNNNNDLFNIISGGFLFILWILSQIFVYALVLSKAFRVKFLKQTAEEEPEREEGNTDTSSDDFDKDELATAKYGEIKPNRRSLGKAKSEYHFRSSAAYNRGASQAEDSTSFNFAHSNQNNLNGWASSILFADNSRTQSDDKKSHSEICMM